MNTYLYNKISKLFAYHYHDGLKEGLSQFSGQSRVALIFATGKNAPVHICDPQHLLQGHEPKLKEIYIDSDNWRENAIHASRLSVLDQPLPEKNLQLAGLISYGGTSRSIFYQMWFTEHHPNVCSIGPTERWLEYAVWLMSQDVISAHSIHSGTSGYVLAGYATRAVYDYIMDILSESSGMDMQLPVYQVLNTILNISNTREEGQWPQGEICFIEPYYIDQLKFMAKFSKREQPTLTNAKHIRKLLIAVENAQRKLVSDGKHVVGIISSESLPGNRLTAHFFVGHGFIRINGVPVCSFRDGSYHSFTHQAKLVQLEELLLDYNIQPHENIHKLFQCINTIVHHAENEKHGCTLVIDNNQPMLKISGQHLTMPLDLRLEQNIELAKSFSKLDGALHISTNLELFAFGCILDGFTVQDEDRARGARFNSALRFTAQFENVIVIVVSEDKPVSVIQGGVELKAQREWCPTSTCLGNPPLLTDWLEKSYDEVV
jgi:DNA integrity scanning protein DisA with diadenylate cyclase activity